MPVYEFLCPSCNRIFSFHSFKVDPDKVPSCPKCNAEDLRRVPSRFGVGAARKSAMPTVAETDRTTPVSNAR